MEINKRYKELLIKFASNQELLELFDLARLDDVREREIYFTQSKSYPQQRDIIGKLLVDLTTTRMAMNNK